MRFSIAAALLPLGLAAGCTAPDPDVTGREVGTGLFGAGVHADGTGGR